MSNPSRRDVAPWIAAGVAGVVLVALLAVYLFGVRPAEGKTAGGLTADERTAMTAAATEVVNSTSYRRAHFEQDFQRALSGATGAFAADLKRDKAATLKSMTDNKFDLSATVTHTALEGPVTGGKQRGYTVLVTFNGFQSTNPNTPLPSQLDVTVLRFGTKWKVSDISSVGLSG